MKELIWKKIPNKNVRLIWRHPKCSRKNCQYFKDVVDIPPTFFENNGTPICSECGDDYEYLRTEIISGGKNG